MPEKLKDIFFTEKTVKEFSAVLAEHYPAFKRDEFEKAALARYEGLELKQKMRATAETLRLFLPESYAEAVEILKKCAPSVKGFEAMALPDFVEVYGQNEPEISLPALKIFTAYSSSEFAIRPFLLVNPEKVMAFMNECAESEIENVRRFASEGCRPRLPWAIGLPAFKKDPSLILPVLEKLKNDPSEFVRRSVANNLNDISKDHPETALEICERWAGTSENADKLIKHALRGLLKAGNERALRIFGYHVSHNVSVTGLKLEPASPQIGGKMQFSFDFEVDGGDETLVRLEYIITYAKAGGKTSRKVFQISEKSFQPGKYTITRNQHFQDLTTRKHYPGKHKITIVANGEKKASAEFMLETRI